jgi:hypothetical protein
MAQPTVFPNPVIFNDVASFSQVPNFPSGSVDNNAVVATANIDASKLICHRSYTYNHAAPTVEPAASTYILLHTANAAGALVGLKAQITGTLSGAGDPVGINLYRSTAGSTFATVLSTTLVLGSTAALMVPVNGTISTSTFSANDSFAFKCTLAGTSTVARGVSVTLTWYEKYA